MSSIYSYNVSSSQDLTRMLDDCDQEKLEKNSNPFGIYGLCKLDEAVKHLDSTSEFKNAYMNSIGLPTSKAFLKETKEIGFPTRKTVVKTITSCQTLLKRTASVCKDSLMPLFIRAITCHQLALENFVKGDVSSATTLMEETGELADKISKEFEKFSDEFSTFSQAVFNCNSVGPSIFRESKITTKNERLKKEFAWLDGANESLHKIKIATLMIHFFWLNAKGHQHLLGNPGLASPFYVKSMQHDQLITQELFAFLQEAEEDSTENLQQQLNHPPENSELLNSLKTLQDTIKRMLPPSSQEEKFKPMKLQSGIGIPLRAQPDPFAFLKAAYNKTLEGEFEKSFYSWLNLAKINQTMIESMQDVLEKLEVTQKEISKIEQDPLLIALDKTSLV